jgi:hypothetical protein
LFFTFLQVTLTFFLATVTVDFAPALVHEAPILEVVVVVATDPDEVAAAATFIDPRPSVKSMDFPLDAAAK